MVSGVKIFSMVRALRLGKTSHAMKESTSKVANTETAPIGGLMAPCTVVSGERTRSVDLEFTNGLMVEDMRANGSKITWRAWATTFGAMAVSMKVNTEMTKSTASVFTPGRMAAATKATGTKVNSMALVPISCQKRTK